MGIYYKKIYPHYLMIINVKHIILIWTILLGMTFQGLATTSENKGNKDPESALYMPEHSKAKESIESYILAGFEMHEKKKYHAAELFYNKALEIIDYYNLSNDHKIIYKHLADNYHKLQNYEKAIEFVNYFLWENDDVAPKVKSKSLHRQAKAYRHIGDLVSAFETQLQNLEIVESLDDTIGTWRSIYDLGNILVFQDDFHGSLEYYFQAEKLALLLEDDLKFLYSSYGAIGNAYHKLDSIEVSLGYNQRALQLAQDIGYEVGIAYSHHNIGNDHFKLKNYETSLEHHNISLALKEEQKDKWGISSSYRMLGYVYTEMGMYKEAEENLIKATEYSSRINAKPMLVEIYDILAKLHKKTGNSEMALHYLNLYIETKEEIRNKNALIKLKSKKSRYDLRKKDEVIKTLEHKRREQNLKMRTFTYVMLSILPFLLLLFFSYTRLRRANALLESKNHLIERQNIALEESNKELEQFAYVASHDMREPIRTIRSFNSLLKRRFEPVLGERGMEFVDFIDDASNRMDVMLTDLLDYSRVNTKDKNKSLISLTDPAFLAAKNLTNKLETEGVKLNVAHLPKVKVNPVQMERLFQNLIANGVKYNDKTEKIIDINYKKNGKAYIISVSDNGIGIAPEHKDKVFEIFRRLHGTAEYEGSGIGLATCKKIVERHDGKIWLDSEPNKGTTVYFSIPFPKEEDIKEAEPKDKKKDIESIFA